MTMERRTSLNRKKFFVYNKQNKGFLSMLIAGRSLFKKFKKKRKIYLQSINEKYFTQFLGDQTTKLISLLINQFTALLVV